MKSKVIALSAISAGFIAISLTAGAYIDLLDLITVIAASIFVILPLYYNSYAGCFMAYAAGGILAFLFSGFNIFSVVFPAYFAFFGIYPIIKAITYGKIKKAVFCVLGAVWCIAMFYGLYFFLIYVTKLTFSDLPQFISDYILVFVGLAGAVFYFVFDRFCLIVKRVVDYYLRRIIK